jgi:hypothetical protein
MRADGLASRDLAPLLCLERDKEILLRYLAQVENRAALGDRLIAEQRARIEQLERAGWGVPEGNAVLVALEDSQRLIAEQRDRLTRKLWAPP